MKKHLKYDIWGAYSSGVRTHPEDEVKRLGITYQLATPQTIGDQWWFWNCDNVPDIMPFYVMELDVNPKNMVGFGLGKDEAEEIMNYE